MSDRTINILIVVVTGVWAINVFLGVLELNGYQPAKGLNGVFTFIVGSAFAARAAKLTGRDNGRDDPNDDVRRNGRDDGDR